MTMNAQRGSKRGHDANLLRAARETTNFIHSSSPDRGRQPWAVLNLDVTVNSRARSYEDNVLATTDQKEQPPKASVVPHLPPEIVQQIVDEFPVLLILRLAASKHQCSYFDQCMLGHPKCQNLFSSAEILSTVRSMFTLCYELRNVWNRRQERRHRRELHLL